MRRFGMPTAVFEGEGGGGGGDDGGSGGGDSLLGDQTPPAGDPSPSKPKMGEGHAFANLPSEVLNNPAIQKFVEAEDPLTALAGGYLGVQKLVGADPSQVVRLDSLKEPEALTSHLQTLGAPKDASGYEFKPAEGTPEGLTGGPVIDAMKEAAAEVGVLPGQFQEVVAAAVKVMVDQGQEDAVDHAANEVAIKLAYGDKFDMVAGDVARVVQTTGGKELKEVLDNAGLGTNPVIFKHFAEVAKLMPVDDAAGGLVGTDGAGGSSKSAMLERAADLNRQAVKIQAEDPVESRRLMDQVISLRMRANGEAMPDGM